MIFRKTKQTLTYSFNLPKHAWIQSGGEGAWGPRPLKNHKYIKFRSNNSPDPLKIKKLPCQHSMLRHHRPASETLFNDDSPLLVLFRSTLPPFPHGKNVIRVAPPLTKLSGSAHAQFSQMEHSSHTVSSTFYHVYHP